MDEQELLNQYMQERYMMQLATLAGDQPWCCTVYYVHDDERNLYWASLPSRRHSREITRHSKVAAAIPVKHIKGEKVIGLQFAGEAVLIKPSELDRSVVESYAAKFGRDQQWIEDFMGGHTEHRLYRLAPAEIIMFDEEHFADDPRRKLL